MQRPIPKDKEIPLNPNKWIISKTDPKGVITYANDYFIDVCQYSKEELIGQPHNIVRHPDMPRIAFKLMWDTIKQNKDFKALVKNLAKDGRYYWVLTKFETVVDPVSNEIVSYTAYRKAAPKNAIKEIIPIYKKPAELEKVGGMEQSGAYLTKFLKDNNTTYEEFLDKITEGKTNIFDGLLKSIIGIFRK